ncbi:MAG: hypothetical protein SVW51_18830 [Pseudomonadota bacterium]|nr:hypothetical protein [Pseudomonadota bacterium]
MNNGPLEIDHGKTLERNEQLKLATSKWLKTASREAKDFLVVLASLHKSPRSINAISKRTSLTKENVKRQLKLAQKCDWISEKYRLTDEGGNLLNQLKSNKKNRRKVEWKIDLLYHPDSLRESRF